MNKQPEEEPKIIVDEDWKTQVQREQEEAKAKSADSESDSVADEADAAGATAEASTTDDSSAAESGQASQDARNEELPPASFTMLVTNLATQAMGAMGHLPGDDGQPLPKNLPVAKHFIDLLSMLEAKTKGNLDANEERYIGDALHQLRMLFVQVGKQ